MGDHHYDSLEIRDPDDRERDFLGRLPDLIAVALSAPGWATQLVGVDPNAVTSRAALAKLPVLRKSELAMRQKEQPPFGGFNVAATARLRRLLMSPGPIFEPQGAGEDFWGAARALFAAGFRAGEQDVMTLVAECAAPAAPLREAVVATLRAVTKLGGEVKLVAPGSLPNDGKMIADERPVG